MRLLVDTVAFLWALDTPERLSRRAMSALASPKAIREISAVSLSEIAIKQASGKLNVSKTDLLEGLADLRLHVLPYTSEHAYRLFDLPLHHADPFDRQIVAQALAEDIPIVTSDRAFHLYEGLRVIW
ncbi:MAG TPA: type II toxin-antitoxin system VapC family toxin [Candidatus Methylomirabilis sp.]|nr:type II toxin-antitoxin system VapC family toxin [Candidatus Methylomirabilis sp.]